MNSEKASENELTQSQSASQIPVVYYDGFDEKEGNRYIDDDEDLDESDGFIFDFKPVNSSAAPQFPTPVKPLGKKTLPQQDDTWSGEPEFNEKNNNDTSLASMQQEERMEITKDSIAYDLRVAIESDNMRKIEELFDKHRELVDVNFVYVDTYWTPLMFAVSVANLKIAKFLIEKGADPEYADDTFSVLMCACGSRELKHDQKRLLDVVKMLVEKGSDVNSADKFYQTPLIYASRAGNTDLVEFLVKLGADIDAMDDNSWTSLAHAAQKGNYSTVIMLLRLGANPLLQTNDYSFPHQLAKSSGFLKVESVLRRFIENEKYEKKYLKNLVKEDSAIQTGISSESLKIEFDEPQPKEEIKKKSTADEATSNDELARFLKGLNLSHLQEIFDAQKIKLKDLLQFNFTDLTYIGITDGPAKKLLSDEIRKINLRNWSSSSLIPLRHDTSINCNEAIAVMCNINRQINYLSANIKYIDAQVMSNIDLLADGFMNAKLLESSKKCAKDVVELKDTANGLCKSLEQKVEFVSEQPIDHLVKPKEKSKLRNLTIKWTILASAIALASFGASITAGRFGIFRKSL